MKLVTRYEIIIEHITPLNAERLGQAISTAIHPIGESKPFKGNILRTITNVLDHNQVIPS